MRTACTVLVLITFAFSLHHAVPSLSWNGSVLVTTRCGDVLGTEGPSNTFVWKGIPFAEPPVGELRWKAARESRPWSGTLAANKFGAPATQMFPFLLKFAYGSENCLTLNIWRPRSPQSGLPVYVYIHGGGNTVGSADLENYHGQTLVQVMNAVFVSVQYRLGPLGWFLHPALTNGATAEDASGNYGTLDLIRALKWVRDNIKAFGGDPAQVTIAGESAGGMNVLSLMISPLAEGLFARAVVESGVAITRTMEEGFRFGEETLEKLFVRDGKAKTTVMARTLISKMDAKEIRAYLYSKSPNDIISVQTSGFFGMLMSVPYIFRDGAVIPREGYDVLNKSKRRAVPLFIGSNKDESKLFLGFDAKLVRNDALYQAKAKYMSLNWKRRGVDEIARAIAGRGTGSPVFVYRFDWGSTGPDGKSVLPGDKGSRFGACHSLEIPFFMGSGKPAIGIATGELFTEENRPGREKLTALMMGYLGRFIHTGDPNGKGSPVWPAWNNTSGKKKGIVFDAGLKDVRISYLTEEVTLPWIFSEMDRELRGDVLAEVRDSVVNWFISK